MSEVEAVKPDVEARERRQLRPYRRLVGVIFTVLLSFAAFIILRGIIRHLDRLPTVHTLPSQPHVDTRALKACAEDLEKLELRVRIVAGQGFSAIPPPGSKPAPWEELAKPLELERLSIVARCRLHEAGDDAVAHDLESAANAIEELLRSYALLYGRHLEGGAPASEEARTALRRAIAALSAR